MVTELRRTKLNESQVQTPTNHCTSMLMQSLYQELKNTYGNNNRKFC